LCTGGTEGDAAGVGAGAEGAQDGGYGHGAIAGAGCRREGEPSDIVTGGPGERASTGVADVQRLGGRVATVLLRGKRQTGGADSNGRWDWRRCHGEGDGDRHRLCTGGTEGDAAGVGAGAEGAQDGGYGHGAIAGAGCRREGEPSDIVTGGPGERASTGVADVQRLGGRVATVLLRGKRQTGGADSNGRWDWRRCHGEGDGDRHRLCTGGTEGDAAGVGAGAEGAVHRTDAHNATTGA